MWDLSLMHSVGIKLLSAPLGPQVPVPWLVPRLHTPSFPHSPPDPALLVSTFASFSAPPPPCSALIPDICWQRNTFLMWQMLLWVAFSLPGIRPA